MRTALSLVLAVWAACAARPVGAQELVVNGGFETATVGIPTGTSFPPYPTVLDGWSAVNTDGECIADGELAHSGTGFMSVLNNGDANPGLPWLGAAHVTEGFDRSAQVVEVAANTEYVLRYWYRGGNGSRFGYTEGAALVQVEEVAPTFTSLGSRQSNATGTWQRDSITFTTGGLTTQVILLFSAVGTTPTDTWYDDVSLRMKHPTSAGIGEAVLSFTTAVDPAADVLRITSSQALDGRTLQLFTLAGAQVRRAALAGNSGAVPLAGLANGVYVAAITGANGRAVRKVLLAR